MERSQQDAHEDRFQVRPTPESHFAWMRTRLGLERTLLAWVRTAVSLIGFGFTIVQFFERLGNMNGAHNPIMPNAPRYLGLALIGAGILSLVICVWQFRRIARYISEGTFEPIAGFDDAAIHTPIYAVSIALIFIGVFAFVAVLIRAV